MQRQHTRGRIFCVALTALVALFGVSCAHDQAQLRSETSPALVGEEVLLSASLIRGGEGAYSVEIVAAPGASEHALLCAARLTASIPAQQARTAYLHERS